ncbi:MAG: hypothetical protein ACREQ5_25660, partial [Candidatus Dormibacteria bacterium]
MATTVFVPQVTPLVSDWLNDVNGVVYGPTSPSGTLRADLASSNGVSMVGNAIDARLLSASTGAGLLGWIQSGVGAVVRTLLAKVRDLPESAYDFGAVGTG